MFLILIKLRRVMFTRCAGSSKFFCFTQLFGYRLGSVILISIIHSCLGFASLKSVSGASKVVKCWSMTDIQTWVDWWTNNCKCWNHDLEIELTYSNHASIYNCPFFPIENGGIKNKASIFMISCLEQGCIDIILSGQPTLEKYPHIWLGGCPNPSKMEQCWECTFLNLYAHVKTKWASKSFPLLAFRDSS